MSKLGQKSQFDGLPIFDTFREVAKLRPNFFVQRLEEKPKMFLLVISSNADGVISKENGQYNVLLCSWMLDDLIIHRAPLKVSEIPKSAVEWLKDHGYTLNKNNAKKQEHMGGSPITGCKDDNPRKIFIHVRENPLEITWSEVEEAGCVNECYIRRDVAEHIIRGSLGPQEALKKIRSL